MSVSRPRRSRGVVVRCLSRAGQTTKRAATLLVVGGLLLVGCSDDRDLPGVEAPAPPTVRGSTTVSVGSTTTAETATTVRPTTANPTTTRLPAPTTAAAIVERQLGNAVRAYFDARDAAGAAPAPNPDHPRLAEVAAGDALDNVRAQITRYREQGQAIANSVANNAQIKVGFVTVTGANATVGVCSVDRGAVVEAATGRVVSDSVATNNYRIDLAQPDGVWKVSRVVRLQKWEGVAGCALAPTDFPY